VSDWKDLPKPEGVGDIIETEDGFKVSISIPTDEDGYFGRQCPACEAPFKMRHDEYERLPDEIELTCLFCGHREEHSSFMSPAQHARVTAAAEGLAEQWLHGQFSDMLSRTFGRRASPPRRSGSFISIGWSYTPGTPPPVRELPGAVEKQTRRTVACSMCGNHHAVYSATSFCPLCGPRPATERVLEAIMARIPAIPSSAQRPPMSTRTPVTICAPVRAAPNDLMSAPAPPGRRGRRGRREESARLCPRGYRPHRGPLHTSRSCHG
jgi:hypothetical protein